MAAVEVDKDMETLMELQGRAIQQSEASSRIMQQERFKQTQKQRFTLTKTEIEAMPDTTKMYRAVGKAYFASPKPEILTELNNKIATTDTDMGLLKVQKEANDKRLQETENELRELVRTAPGLIRKLGQMRMQ